MSFWKQLRPALKYCNNIRIKVKKELWIEDHYYKNYIVPIIDFYWFNNSLLKSYSCLWDENSQE